MMIHEHVLTEKQLELAGRLLPHFREFYLAGGTALALLIGHRRSLDYDLALPKPISPFAIERKLHAEGFSIQRTMAATTDELSVLVEDVKVTFFTFPFIVPHDIAWGRAGINLPGLMELAAMKAYALGRRSKWKDYVDLYFLFKTHLDMGSLIGKANLLFAGHFNARLFREQLCYYDDMDFSEEVEYLRTPPDAAEIRAFLTEMATRI
jgi:hypothetical protein